jgi:hypothetical protein
LLPSGKEAYSYGVLLYGGERRRGLDLEFGDCGDSEAERKVGDVHCGGAGSAGRLHLRGSESETWKEKRLNSKQDDT